MSVGVLGAVDHSANAELGGSRRAGAPEAAAECLVSQKASDSGAEGGHVTGGDEEARLPLENKLRESADCEGDGRDAEGHRVDYRGAEPLSARGMPEHVQPRHGAVYLVDEAGAKGLDPAERFTRGRLPPEQDEPRLRAQRLGKMDADLGEEANSFLGGHGTDDAAQHGVGAPSALGAPVARCTDVRNGNPRVDDIDTAGGDPTALECIANGVRDRDKARHTLAVLESPARDKGDASGHHERERALADQCAERQCVGARVVGVYDVGAPSADEGAQPACGHHVPVGAHAHAAGGEAGASESVQ